MDEILELRLLITQYRVSQKELAKRAGYTEEWVSMVLNKKRSSLDTVARLKTALNELIAEKTA